MKSALIGALALCAATAAFAQEPTVYVEEGLAVWDKHREELNLDARTYKVWSVKLKADERIAIRSGIEKNWASPPTIALCLPAEFQEFQKSGQLLASCKKSQRVQSTSGFLEAPATGNDGVYHAVYHAVILNGLYAERNAIKISIEVQRPLERSALRGWPDALRELDGRLHSSFRDFQFIWYISRCNGVENAFYSDHAKMIVLCTPYVDHLERWGAKGDELGNTLLFVLLHEVGHGLLDQWSLPGTDNEEMADEMGAVLLLEFPNGEKLVGSAMRYWQAQAANAAADAEMLAFEGDTHPSAIQRARKLATVAEFYDDKYARYGERWRNLVYRFMMTATLEKRARGEGAYADASLARSILATREDSIYYAQNGKGEGAVAMASAPLSFAKWLTGVRDPGRRAEVETQAFLVALINDYAGTVGEPTAFRDAINTGTAICLSACRDGAASKVVIGDKITASDFVKMVMTSRYGATENAANRWAALERIDAVVAKLGADKITLSKEDAAYFADTFAKLVSTSKALSGRAYPNIDRLIARARAAH